MNKKILLFIGMLPLISLASEETVSARLGIVSNHLFRGESWSGNKPALQGGVNYHYQQTRSHLNLDVGASLSNVPALSSQGVETSFFGKYAYHLTPSLSLHAGGMKFRYPHDTSWDFGHYALGASWNDLSFQVERWATESLGYSLTWKRKKFRFLLTGEERFWGRNSSYLYSEVGQDFRLKQNWDVSLIFGYASFGNNRAAGYSDHYNHKLALVHTRGDLIGTLFIADTNRVVPETGENIEDATLGASLVRNF